MLDAAVAKRCYYEMRMRHAAEILTFATCLYAMLP